MKLCSTAYKPQKKSSNLRGNCFREMNQRKRSHSKFKYCVDDQITSLSNEHCLGWVWAAIANKYLETISIFYFNEGIHLFEYWTVLGVVIVKLWFKCLGIKCDFVPLNVGKGFLWVRLTVERIGSTQIFIINVSRFLEVRVSSSDEVASTSSNRAKVSGVGCRRHATMLGGDPDVPTMGSVRWPLACLWVWWVALCSECCFETLGGVELGKRVYPSPWGEYLWDPAGGRPIGAVPGAGVGSEGVANLPRCGAVQSLAGMIRGIVISPKKIAKSWIPVFKLKSKILAKQSKQIDED